jgi:beta-glucosidase
MTDELTDAQISTTPLGGQLTANLAIAEPDHMVVLPDVSQRVREIHERMSLDEKLAQVVGYWWGQDGSVAPMQSAMAVGGEDAVDLGDITRHGIGHYTRVYGTRPVDPAARAAWLWREQRRLKRETRLGIPALVHEECLTGLAAWQAAVFPTPLAWGASFDPALVERCARAIGTSMHTLGIHQGLAPVLDVIRDARWGRVDECISEDPYLVGVVGTAYVRGLQSAGVHATLKHFVGYSVSTAGRNHAPVSMGPREVADVYLPPFLMAIVDGGAESVMNAYTALDGVPMAADAEYLTRLLREQWGFEGVVVADYFSIAFLEVMQRIAADRGEAAELALTAGVDVELPSGDAYLAPLAERIRSGALDERYLDRSVLRVLRQKEKLGLLEPGAYEDDPPAFVDLDTAEHRELARRLAAESVVLLANDGVLPLAPELRRGGRIAIIGPNADRAEGMQGCYSFTNHVLPHFPEVPMGVRVPTVAEALRAALNTAAEDVEESAGGTRAKAGRRPADSGTRVTVTAGCTVAGEAAEGIPDAVAAAADADIAVVVVGDQAGLFGRGTVGEGNDVASLELPGVQRRLVEEVVATGTPVVLVVISGRPYALDWALDAPAPGAPARRPAAVLQAFFPGEAGGTAIADILVGDTAPSGRLPISLPRSAGSQPYSYLHPVLGGDSEVTASSTRPVRPFGFGLGYTRIRYDDLAIPPSCGTAGMFDALVTLTNTGDRTGVEIVQLYGRILHASVPRPIEQLLGFARVELEAGETVRVRFRVPAARFAFPGRNLISVVEPGDAQIWAAAHAGTEAEVPADAAGVDGRDVGAATPRATLTFTGTVHEVTLADARTAEWQRA